MATPNTHVRTTVVTSMVAPLPWFYWLGDWPTKFGRPILYSQSLGMGFGVVGSLFWEEMCIKQRRKWLIIYRLLCVSGVGSTVILARSTAMYPLIPKGACWANGQAAEWPLSTCREEGPHIMNPHQFVSASAQWQHGHCSPSTHGDKWCKP